MQDTDKKKKSILPPKDKRDAFKEKVWFHFMGVFTALILVIAFSMGGMLLVDAQFDDITASFILDGITILICGIWYFLKFRKNDVERRKEIASYDKGRMYGFLLILFFIMFLASQTLALWYYASHGDASYSDYQDRQESAQVIIGFIFTVVVAPIAEEILCRGVIYNYLKRSIFWVASIFITSFLFAFLHGTMVHMFVGIMEGFVFNLAYEITRDLKVNIGIHMLSNLLTYVPFIDNVFPYKSVVGVVIFSVIAFFAMGVSIAIAMSPEKILINESFLKEKG